MKETLTDKLLLFVSCLIIVIIFTMITTDSSTYISKETLMQSFKNI